jgi:hypothetical protein
VEREFQDFLLGEGIFVLREKQKSQFSVPGKPLDYLRDGGMQVNVPNPVLQFSETIQVGIQSWLSDGAFIRIA